MWWKYTWYITSTPCCVNFSAWPTLGMYALCKFLFICRTWNFVVSVARRVSLLSTSRPLTLPKIPESKVHGANVGPTWALSAPDGPHVGPLNLAIRNAITTLGNLFAQLGKNRTHPFWYLPCKCSFWLILITTASVSRGYALQKWAVVIKISCQFVH